MATTLPRQTTTDDTWKDREHARLYGEEPGPYVWTADGRPVYRPIPTPVLSRIPPREDGFPDFLHCATTNGMVAYTPDDTKGRADVQVVSKLGGYLVKTRPSISARLVTELSEQFAGLTMGDQDIKFADSADDIERVYVEGPCSCMGGSSWEDEVSRALDDGDLDPDQASMVHPVRAYAGPDLQVAYIEGPDGSVSARCVVWPDKKIHGRVYGSPGLAYALQARGYVYGSLVGARLTRLPPITTQGDRAYPDAVVVPFIDPHSSDQNCITVTVDPVDRQHLTITDGYGSGRTGVYRANTVWGLAFG
jgi:hypothetical protein